MGLHSGNSTIAGAVRIALYGVTLSALAMASTAARADGTPAAISAHSAPGAILGIVTDANHQPVAHATVTVTSADGATFRAVLSGADGSYALSDLPAGSWSLSTEVDGAAALELPSVAVESRKAKRIDIVMNTAAPDAPVLASAATVPAPRGATTAATTVATTATTTSAPAAGATTAAAAKPAGDGEKVWAKLFQAAFVPVAPAISHQAPGAATAAAPPGPAPTVPEALQAPDPAPPGVDNDTPFAFADFTWVNGNTREKAPIFDTKFFTPEIRFDMNYLADFNHPVDHTIVGSTEEFRADEFQIEQVSFGGDFHWNNVKARFLSMMGLFATTTPPNDASSGVGQWDLHSAYKYFSEANAGYHWDINHGLNVDAGIFVSYIGLFAYYNFDNWTYQPSFVSSNTPWFFNGLRIQWFPTNKLKIEPWIINGWQSYAKYNNHPGFGGQIAYTPNENVRMVFNSYGVGQDNLAGSTCAGNGVSAVGCEAPNMPGTGPLGAAMENPNPNAPAINYAKVTRIHEDDSLIVKYFDSHGNGSPISKMAFSLTADIGCEYGGGVTCTNGVNKANFVGAMAYNRIWFNHDIYAVTLGGGFMNNPGRYLALTPPVNGASAQINSPYFTQAPGDKLYQWDMQLNFQYMPKDWITWWTETTFRHSDVPYFAGANGVTPPGGNTGSPGSLVSCSGYASNCIGGGDGGGTWYPDLRTREVIWGAGVMIRF
jgi:hypothetical protein